jgi:hypothetical protein
MNKLILSFILLSYPVLAQAEFNRYDPLEQQFLREELMLPYAISLTDEVTGNCWTNIDASRAALRRPLSEIGIEFARATGNYIALKVEGQRYNSTCVGHVSIQLLTDATPNAAKWSSMKAPILKSEVISVSALVLSVDNLNEEILRVLKGFSNSLTQFLSKRANDD